MADGVHKQKAKVAPSIKIDVNELNKFFSKGSLPMYGPVDLNPEHDWNETQSKFSFQHIFDDDIIHAIYAIKSDAAGNDEIPMRFVKLLSPVILPVLRHLFNEVVTRSVFPEVWKKAVVTPLKKTSNPSSLSDFRPISLLPVTAKILEKIMLDQITAFIDGRNLLDRHQSAYRAKHSTTTLLAGLVQDFKRKLDNKMCVSLVMIDFTSAFNSMCHKRLVEKLRNQFQFTVTASKLIFSFISNREQVVKLGDIISESCTQTSGSPQGSSLSSLLFCLYVNDLVSEIQHCERRTYADDLQVYISSTPEDLATNTVLLNQDLQRIENWSMENQMLPNPKKTKGMLISKQAIAAKPSIIFMQQEVDYCDVARNLGLMIDHQMDWQCQVSTTCKKVHHTLHTLRMFQTDLSFDVRMLLARSVIMPIFLYSDVVYFPSINGEQKLRLERCFKSTLRFVHGLRGRDSTRNVRNTLVGLDLPLYMNLRLAVFVFKALRGLQPQYITEEFPRGASQRTLNLAVPRQPSTWIQNSTVVKGIAVWNRLPEECKRARNVETFKEKTRRFLENVNISWPFL